MPPNDIGRASTPRCTSSIWPGSGGSSGSISGESIRYPGRSVSALIGERVGNTVLLGLGAMSVATAIGIPLGVITGRGRRNAFTLAARGVSVVLLALPPIVLSLALLLVASRTGCPVGGLPTDAGFETMVRHLVLPTLALALPVAATLQHLEATAISEALQHPSVRAARARGVPDRRVLWRHASDSSLTPVLAVYGS